MVKLKDWESIAITVKFGADGESAWQRRGFAFNSYIVVHV
jgi:hypothetical protein